MNAILLNHNYVQVKFQLNPILGNHNRLNGRALDDFCLKFISNDSNGARPGPVWCLTGHRTISDKRQELKQIF